MVAQPLLCLSGMDAKRRNLTRNVLPGCLLVWIGLAVVPTVALAHHRDGQSLLSYGGQGLVNGAMVGLSIGYLSRGDGRGSDDWKHIVYGTGIGALAGTGVGAVLALTDVASDSRSGEIVLRDTRYGTLLGAASGSLAGLLFYVHSGVGSDILQGGAIGALAGGVFGIVYGLIDAGNQSDISRRQDHRWGRRSRQRNIQVVIGAAPTDGGATIMSGVHGRF